MNTWQAAKQLKTLLLAAVWSESPAAVVFPPNGVYVTAGGAEEAIARVRLPCAIVRILDNDADDESPSLKRQKFEIIIVVRNQGDAMGEHALLGGSRASEGKSEGKGLLQIEEKLYETIDKLNYNNGVRLKEVATTAAEAAHVDGHGVIATRSYTFESVLMASRSYPPVSGFAGVVNAGSVDMTWTLAPNRYDTMTQVMRRIAGSTPVSDPTLGTSIAVGAAAVSLSNSPGSGTWSYSLFAAYADLQGAGTVTDYSVAETITVVVP